ncbi:MAG: hypothetical protein U0457_04935 [Candidatus Sericytochromatia bacterium]
MEKLEEVLTASLYVGKSSEGLSCTIKISPEIIVASTENENYIIPIKEAEYFLTGEKNLYLIVKNEQISLCIKFHNIYESIIQNTNSIRIHEKLNQLKEELKNVPIEKKDSALVILGVSAVTIIYSFTSFIVLIVISVFIFGVFSLESLKVLFKILF